MNPKKPPPTQNAIIAGGCAFILICLIIRLFFQSIGITLH